uniref:Uncharacterized protein n=1 Tax=Anguilla anguilla TaxID=7936 RepID=A0A0E9UAI4_ANGAN
MAIDIQISSLNFALLDTYKCVPLFISEYE